MDRNDLISRSELKKAFALLMWKEYTPYSEVKVCDIVNQTLDFIDNAPTVEYTFEEAFQKTVCEKRLYCPERR